MITELASSADASLVKIGWFVLAYFMIVNGFYAVLLVSAAWEMHWHALEVARESRHRVLSSQIAPRISVLVPAYNESATIVESVNALLTLAYPNLEVVVIDDGSTDDTLDVMIEAFGLVPVHPVYRRRLEVAEVGGIYRSSASPQLVVATKENGGKADSLNAALNLSTGDLVCSLDADTIVEEDALQRLVRPFIRSTDVVAAGATIRIANGCVVRGGRMIDVASPRHPLTGFQAIEYLRGFLFGRLGWNRLGSNIVISGAFGLFRRDALMSSGGYAHGVGEDVEIIVRLRRLAYEKDRPRRVVFVPDPVAWTEAPSSVRVLGRQRNRWHRGLSETLWSHRRMFFNPRYGVLGTVILPVFTFIEWLAPVVEALGLVVIVTGLMVGAVDVWFALLFFAAAYLFGLVLSTLALVLEEFSYRRYGGFRDRLILLTWAVLENLGYRQLTVWWRLRGIADFLRGDSEWGVMERRGFAGRS